MTGRVFAALLALCIAAAAPCAAQTTGPLPQNASVSVRLRDGSILVGRITEQLTDSVEITTGTGRFMLARSALREIKLLSPREVQDGAFWPADPHDTRLFFGPTGRTLARGTGYFSDTEILVFNGAVGITDRIMIGAGMSVIPFPSFLHDNLYYVAPKFAIVRSDSFSLAAGAIIGFAGRLSGSASIYYIAGTNGGPDASFTYGLGYANAAGTVHSSPILLFGGTKRVARKLALMSENYVIVSRSEVTWAPVYGVRFIGDKLSTDLGFVNYVGHNATPIFPGVPWLGFALKF